MKTRTLIRKHGWTSVDVAALEIAWDYNFWFKHMAKTDNENKDHYQQIIEWCDQNIGKGNYSATLQNGTPKHNVKRFVFKYSKHATMFRLRWLTS